MADTKLTGITPLSAPISPGDDSRDSWPTHFAKWGAGGLKIVDTIADRDAITPERRVNTMALVLKDDDGFVNCYVWDGSETSGSWKETPLPGGVILADTNGALPDRVKTIVLGPDFTVEKAGDQEGGALVRLAKGTGSGVDFAGMDIHMAAPDQQYGANDVKEITTLPPLNVWADPDKQNAVKLEIKHGTFEPIQSPSFLAYLSEGEEVLGKDKNGAVRAHHDGALWFDDIVWPSGPYIETKRDEKTYGIQEADELDPNVSGGMDYLVAFRAHMRGVAPEDGWVRAYLFKAKTPFDSASYLEDKDGRPLVVERQYKRGEELGALDVMGIVNAKGLTEFTCHVVDSFTIDTVFLTDRSEGVTGLMIQALTKDSKLGMGLLGFEADTKQNIVFSSHYMGEEQTTLKWAVSQDLPVITGEAGQGLTSVSGGHLYNLYPMKGGIQNGHVVLSDSGSDICDFNFGDIFSAEKTKMLRDKDVDITVTVTDKDSGFIVSLMKWVGKPDEYTKAIFKSRKNGAPVFEKDWIESASFSISEDIVKGDHTVTKTLRVPADANNYAVIIYPTSAQQPLTLLLKELRVDVHTPFYGYVLHAPELLSEAHLEWSSMFKKFVQDTQGYASLRYTLIDAKDGLPMPVGVEKSGLADVVLDPSVNKVPGSEARGGEGVLKFNKDAKINITGQIRVWNEKGVSSNGEMWWCKVDEDGGLTKIDDSVTFFGANANTKNSVVNLKPLKMEVEKGDRLALRAKADKYDGLFLECTSPSQPLISLNVEMIELVPTN